MSARSIRDGTDTRYADAPLGRDAPSGTRACRLDDGIEAVPS
jgi:hypothetical protein